MKLALPILQKNENVCIALSGGLDSTVLMHALVREYGASRVKCLGFNFGQRHNVELQLAAMSAEKVGVDFEVLKLGYLGDITKGVSSLIQGSELEPEKATKETKESKEVSTYVPFRNLQFAAITAAYAESNSCKYIFQGINAVDQYGYWDTTIDFRDALNSILDLSGSGIQFVSPFVKLSKKDELVLAKELSQEFGFDILGTTWSCYRGPQEKYSYKECGLTGRCNTCIEKITGYIQAEYSDEVILEQFSGTEKELNEFKKSMKEEVK